MLKKVTKKALKISKNAKLEEISIQQYGERKSLTNDLEQNEQALRQAFESCSDVIFRIFILNTDKPLKALLIYVDALTEVAILSEHLLDSLLLETDMLTDKVKLWGDRATEQIMTKLSGAMNVQTTGDINQVIQEIASGSAALLIDSSSMALIIGAPAGESRSISEPDTEPVVRGPKDGFVESLRTNVSLLRRRIRTNNFKVETIELGALTKTKVAVCYISGIVNEKILQEVWTRLKRINVDGIMDSGYIEELIADEPFSIFPLIQSTERPDRTAASILEGRIAIVVDNTPMTLIVPCTFVTLLQASEDYYMSSFFATLIRLLRFLALNIALLLPAVTVAAFSFHQELIPTTLLNTVAGARQELPFPIFVEILFMELTFELLREAGLRLPKTVGQAVSTVGGLVIGEAAVNAGFVSPLSVIVVALTAVASFTSPNYIAGTGIRLLRFALLFLAPFLGGVGIILGLMFILVHLCSLRSFGVPYLSPIAPLSFNDLKDTFIRAPWWSMQTRPRFYGDREPVRMSPDEGPSKPDENPDRGGE